MPDQTIHNPRPRRPQISRQFVEEHRRRRYVDAAAELLHEFGREGPSVTNIVRLAGTARNSFYEVFKSAEDCIGYGIGVAAGELFGGLEALNGEGEWLDEIQEAIVGFYAAAAAGPILAELFLIHAGASRIDHGRAAARLGVERFSAILARGRRLAEDRDRGPLPISTEDYFSHAVISLAARRLERGAVETLPREASAMAALIGGFFLGTEAPDRVLAGPAASRPGSEPVRGSGPTEQV